jgi:hypothetical protein
VFPVEYHSFVPVRPDGDVSSVPGFPLNQTLAGIGQYCCELPLIGAYQVLGIPVVWRVIYAPFI